MDFGASDNCQLHSRVKTFLSAVQGGWGGCRLVPGLLPCLRDYFPPSFLPYFLALFVPHFLPCFVPSFLRLFFLPSLISSFVRVPRGSVVKCLTRNPGVLGSSLTGSSGFFPGSVLGEDTSEPRPSTGETQERHE